MYVAKEQRCKMWGKTDRTEKKLKKTNTITAGD